MNSQYLPTANLKELLSHFEEQMKQAAERIKERKNLRLAGIITGACILLYFLLQNVLTIPLFVIKPIMSLYSNSVEFQSIVNIILSVVGLMVPFALGGLLLHKKKILPTLALGRPNSFPLMFSAVPFGFFICLAANYISNIIVSLTRTSGVELTSPDFSAPESLAGKIIYVISIAAIPPLVEEFAVRGVVMQSLRRYGDGFAIVVSSIIFGIMHGNLVQAPFAFIAGLGMGYAVCITNSIWTGVLIHFCNNFYSAIATILVSEIKDEALLDKIWLILMIVLYALSIAGTVVFAIVKRRKRLDPPQVKFDRGTRIKAFFLNPTLIIAFILLGSIIVQSVRTAG